MSPKVKVKEEVTTIIAPGTATKRELEPMDDYNAPAEPDEYLKEIKFLEVIKLSPIVMKALVSDHIIDSINNCVLKGIKLEGGKRRRHRAVYLDSTNSSSETETECNNVSIILDTPSFDAKVLKKPKFSPTLSSSTATLSPISLTNGLDNDAFPYISLNSDIKDNIDSCSWDSDKSMACFHCSELSSRPC